MKNSFNIHKIAKENDDFRRELITGEHSQVVLMSVKSGEDIGEEVHDVDQILMFVDGTGEAVIENETSTIESCSLVFVPAGKKHNFMNIGDSDLKLFTIYAPPEHKPGTINQTKMEAMEE